MIYVYKHKKVVKASGIEIRYLISLKFNLINWFFGMQILCFDGRSYSLSLTFIKLAKKSTKCTKNNHDYHLREVA